MKQTSRAFEKIEQILTEKGFRFERTDFNRPWGGFFVIEEEQAALFIETYYPEADADALTKGGRVSPKILVVHSGKRLSWQYHHRRSEVWKLIEGEAGLFRSDTDEQGDLHMMTIGEKVTLQQGERHRLIGGKEIGIIAEIWQHTDPNNLSDESDIVRLQDDFGR
ncbi:MAG: mannose-6-phosphate isomerase [Polaribacter sp.]|jgi:mannose-6-phosphate isomerase